MTMLQQLSEVVLLHRQRSAIAMEDFKSLQSPQILHCLLQLQKNPAKPFKVTPPYYKVSF